MGGIVPAARPLASVRVEDGVEAFDGTGWMEDILYGTEGDLSKDLIVRRGADLAGAIKKCWSFWVHSELIFIFASPSKEG